MWWGHLIICLNQANLKILNKAQLKSRKDTSRGTGKTQEIFEKL